MKIKKSPPFEFVLELLEPISPQVRPMFGCHALYVDEKILVILREKPTEKRDNGVWIATVPEHHESLKKDFPTLRSIELFGSSQATTWQNLPVSSPDFENDVTRLCKMILKKDPRIGKIPGKKSKKR